MRRSLVGVCSSAKMSNGRSGRRSEGADECDEAVAVAAGLPDSNVDVDVE